MIKTQLFPILIAFGMLAQACAPGRITPAAQNSGPPPAFPAAATAVPTAAPLSVAPIARPTSTATPLPEPVYDASKIASLEKLSSYVITTNFLTTDAKSGPKMTRMEVIPKAGKAHLTISGIDYSKQYTEAKVQATATAKKIPLEELKKELSEYHLYWIGDDQVLQESSGFWQLYATQGTNLDYKYYTQYAGFSDLLRWLTTAHYAGQETFNGILCNHFTFDQSNFDAFRVPPGMVIEQASGAIDLAVEGNFPVHLEVSMKGQHFSKPTDGSADPPKQESAAWVVDLITVNALTDIPLPEKAQAFFPKVDWPTVPGARLLRVSVYSTDTGMMEYETDWSVAQVVEYMQSEAPKMGWKVMVEQLPGAKFTWVELTKGGVSKHVKIRPDPETGKTKIEVS